MVNAPKPTGAWAVRAALSNQLDTEIEAGRSGYDSIKEYAKQRHTIDSAMMQALDDQYGNGIHLRGKGLWQRFKPPGKHNPDGYAAVLSNEVAIFGVWGNEKHLVVLSDDEMTKEERREHRQNAREDADRRRREHQTAEKRRHAQKAERAASEVRAMPWANASHPYLIAKGIEAPGLKQKGPLLVAPMTDGQTIVNYQTIAPDGNKRFLAGARKQGCYFALGHLSDRLVICEGVATAISIHMAYDCAVAAAMDCGNLKPVALNLRQRHPDLPIVVMADNDYHRDDNPGVTHGKAAAEAVKGQCVWPSKNPNKPDGMDFNDLFIELGGMLL
ncbi:toprim domain-containing protein [Billgrantia montanilacus]|uniref:Toprim domain-containing protein n=1 Tax=Billgrantia montanilacus TaxID=2282305 RepID=A0A368U0E0_9GAMM|nr:toprim domain-containing protein [Halomonas montanilacus]RCV90484.1 hypothetical protein DU505_05990 [Halomonas montanilacus]